MSHAEEQFKAVEDFELKKIFLMYLGCKCIVDVTTKHSGKGKNFELKKVPGVFVDVRENPCQWCHVRYNELESMEGLQFYDTFDKLCKVYSETYKANAVKLLLRHPREMTGIELEEQYAFESKLQHESKQLGSIFYNAAIVRWHTDKGFDLFDLREKGYALYPNDLKDN